MKLKYLNLYVNIGTISKEKKRKEKYNMRKERVMKNKRIFVVCGIIISLVLILTGCGKKDTKNESAKEENNNQVQNVEKQDENTTKTEKNSTEKTNKSEDTSSSKKATTPSKLVVNREGMSDEVASKEHSSNMGYTMRYATENFKVSHHDDADWFEEDGGINCVVVEKENKSYSKTIASVSNSKKTTVNGYEAVYTSRFVEGQHENTYYVNTGKDSTYIITTSCQGDTEHMEGLEHIMDAMVQTFAVK